MTNNFNRNLQNNRYLVRFSKKSFYKILKFLLNICLLFSIIGSFCSFFSQYNYVFDICSTFCVQYFLVGCFGIIFHLYFKSKEKWYIILSILVILINLLPVINNFKLYNGNYDINSGDFLKIAHINVLQENNNYDIVHNELLKNEPSIIVLEEIDDLWIEKLQKLKNIYPFFYEIGRQDYSGIGVYSKYPIIKTEKILTGDYKKPAISFVVSIDNKEIEILAVHVLPPKSQFYFEDSKKVFSEIAEYVLNSQKNIIIIGDFNTSFFSNNYKSFIKKVKLNDAGGIMAPTWPAFYPVFCRITLDHILVSDNLKIINFKTGSKVDSDHLPIYAEIIIKN